MSSPSAKKERRKKRRWGDAPTTSNNTSNKDGSDSTKKSKAAPVNAKSKALALQASIAARLAALKASKAAATAATAATTASSSTKKNKKKRSLDSSPSSATVPNSSSSIQENRPVKKAKVYDLDMSITTPQFKKQVGTHKKEEVEVKKKKINPYLAHLEQDENDGNTDGKKSKSKTDSNGGGDGSNSNNGEEILDVRLGQLKGGKNKIVKNRLAGKKINFIEPGTYIEKAKKKHLANINAIQSGYRSGRKQGTYINATAMATVVEEGDDDGTGAKNENDYYGTNTNQDARSLVPRIDAIYTSHGSSGGGGTKDTNGVVPIPIPLVMEWWDIPLLPKQLRKELVEKEGALVMKNTKQKLMNTFQQNKKKDDAKQSVSSEEKENGDDAQVKKQSELEILRQKCFITASITNSKTHQLVQHPQPIIPPSMRNLPEKPKAVLHLTKKELKRQRKLRRAEKQREIQDLQSVGLLPKPEPKLTLSNYMRVLGTQAVLDPSQMEQKVQEQIQARKNKHEKMNLDRKVKAKELRTQKKEEEAKIGGGAAASEAVSVALFLVQDMSHRYHRTKVDLNAQQWNITGGVLECQSDPQLALVIAEGDAKAIKKYSRFMTVRMKWKGENFANEDNDEEDDEDIQMGEDGEEIPKKQKFNPNNSCDLVWTGMAAKRMFRSFIFQSCASSDHARKILEAKGVAHFWDQVLVHASGTGESFNFKLG